MRYLLDTAALLWALDDWQRLNKRAQDVLQDRAQELFLSPVVSWEMVIKAGRGKLRLSKSARELVQRAISDFGALSLPITHEHSLALAGLPDLHSDPLDRMLIAQAQTENLTVMTADEMIGKYPVDTFWCAR
jgi:PIN domain nuclease of toxin-antitoxin system